MNNEKFRVLAAQSNDGELRGPAIAAADEIDRLNGLMRERMGMLERYNAMVKEAAVREEFWKARAADLEQTQANFYAAPEKQ